MPLKYSTTICFPLSSLPSCMQCLLPHNKNSIQFGFRNVRRSTGMHTRRASAVLSARAAGKRAKRSRRPSLAHAHADRGRSACRQRATGSGFRRSGVPQTTPILPSAIAGRLIAGRPFNCWRIDASAARGTPSLRKPSGLDAEQLETANRRWPLEGSRTVESAREH